MALRPLSVCAAAEQGAKMARFINQLEPEGLIAAFMRHPPDGFTPQIAPNGLPLFFTRFDLLTTADPALRLRLSGWPGYARWSRWLTMRTCFIGTTTSEYALLPVGREPDELLQSIDVYCRRQPLTIVKDLPLDSPLLSDGDNALNRRLIAAAERRGFVRVAGQALALVPIDFGSIDEFLARMSHSRRRNIRRKLRSRDALHVEAIPCGDVRFEDRTWCNRLYQCYLAVWQQSDIHFDRLSADFFEQLLLDGESGGQVFCYWHQQQLVGFNLCYRYQGYLVDKYIGFDYALALRFNLYFVSWFINLEYALACGLRAYIAGWTDPAVKASLGARFTATVHLVRVRNPLLRVLLRCLRHRFESDSRWTTTPCC